MRPVSLGPVQKVAEDASLSRGAMGGRPDGNVDRARQRRLHTVVLGNAMRVCSKYSKRLKL